MDTHPGGPSEKIVQPYVANLGMYKLIMESIVPTVTSFFIGPWSDTYGRRPIMIFPLLGDNFSFCELEYDSSQSNIFLVLCVTSVFLIKFSVITLLQAIV